MNRHTVPDYSSQPKYNNTLHNYVALIIQNNLYSCSDEQKQYLLDVGIFGDLQLIVDGFMYNSYVIAEAFCVIACLSDLCE